MRVWRCGESVGTRHVLLKLVRTLEHTSSDDSSGVSSGRESFLDNSDGC